jgi:hypothetical protein
LTTETLDNAMKTTLLVLFILCAAMAFGQNGAVLSNQVNVMEFPEHPQHAAPHALASEQSIVGGGSYTVEHGERPLWEFGPVSEKPSLGEVARAYRKEKMAAKKAAMVLEKQGS